MTKLVSGTLCALSLVGGIVSSSFASNIVGAGASFPAPIYVKWAEDYKKETNKQVNYQSIGSSGGVKQIISQTVDFGASDAPLSDEKLKENNLFQFPTVIGGIVMVVNLEGVKSGDLTLNGEVIADIFMGKIKKWNDSAIAKLNPNVKLPNQDIAVVRRADGSGTSFVFTGYLSKMSKEWKEKIGQGNTVKWLLGVGGKGNEGISAMVQRVAGSIGYVEYAYAKQNNLTYTKLISADGESILPTRESFSNAAKETNWNETFAQDLTNQKGKNAWPISSTTFVLIDTKPSSAKKNQAVLDFFKWSFDKGEKQAVDLDYSVLPESLIKTIKEAWDKSLPKQ